MKPVRPILAILALAGAATALAGCAHYDADPLAPAPNLATSPTQLSIDPQRLGLAPLSAVRIDPSAPLDPVQVAVLAVLNNPDLKARRAALGVAAAQVFNAGLLPDPELSTGVDQPIAGPDTHTAFNASPAIDIAAIITRGASARSARESAKQADLDTLWAEWTMAQQARVLTETIIADETRADMLETLARAAHARAERSAQAAANGDLSAPTAVADRGADLDLQAQAASVRQEAESSRRDLNALLGLQPQVRLSLADGAPSTPLSDTAIQDAIDHLPQRRPDLLALQAGYAAQDANLRKAILTQFPLASAAIAYARDPTPTTTIGLSAVLALPIFNGHRGEVRIEAATRAQLKAEYAARLDQTASDVAAAQANLAAAQAQAQALAAALPQMADPAAPAAAALDRGDLDSQAALTLQQSALSRRADMADRLLTARIAEIQLETDLFLPPASEHAP